MKANRIVRTRALAVKALSQFDEEPAEFVIPEDLSALSVDDLTALRTQSREVAASLRNEDGSLSADAMGALRALGAGVARLDAEIETRAAAAAEVEDEATRLLEAIGTADEAPEAAEEDEPEAEATDEPEAEEEDEPEALAASGETRISPALMRRRAPRRDPEPEGAQARTIADFAHAAAGVPGMGSGGLDWDAMGRAVQARLKGYDHKRFAAAAARGQQIRETLATIVIDKPVDPDLVVSEEDSEARVESVFEHAVSESRLPGGSLVASGGWCAPSETVYDLFDQGESRDGMISLPEVTVRRGGLRFPLPFDFSGLATIGWEYTEAQDIAGNYGVDANGIGNGNAGDKPCYVVDCPDFDEERLLVDGLCIQAGLLQRKGYPEFIGQTVSKALVYHDHKMNARKIQALIAGSTAVNMPATQAGTIAPVLTAIELQVEHYRYQHVQARNTTLEAVFPYWIHGAVRSDLSRRLGLAEFDVNDARINAWFASRGVRPQFVYDWQSLASSGATGATSWPANVQFLLYKAGTWVVGGTDILTVDTMYDSTLLANNDYTALWTEEGYVVIKRGVDSRLVTCSIVPDGATHVGVDIARNGTA